MSNTCPIVSRACVDVLMGALCQAPKKSVYELKRDQNIQENNQMLVDLGIGPNAWTTVQGPEPEPEQERATPSHKLTRAT